MELKLFWQMHSSCAPILRTKKHNRSIIYHFQLQLQYLLRLRLIREPKSINGKCLLSMQLQLLSCISAHICCLPLPVLCSFIPLLLESSVLDQISSLPCCAPNKYTNNPLELGQITPTRYPTNFAHMQI